MKLKQNYFVEQIAKLYWNTKYFTGFNIENHSRNILHLLKLELIDPILLNVS